MPLDYLPPADDDLLKWAKTFSSNIATDGAAIGVSASDISASQDSCNNIVNSILDHFSAQKAARQAKAKKDETIKAGKKQLRQVIQAFKKNNSYTSDVGKHLGVIGNPYHLEISTYRPAMKALGFSGHVAIKFYKKGVQGVNIYTRLNGGTVWNKLSFASRSPYLDTRPLAVANQPEAREYMAIGVIADEEFGQASKIVQVMFGG